MQKIRHTLVAQTLGTPREVISLHFGPQGQGRKAYLQAGLHADEHPGMLVLHHLKQRLMELEAAGRLTGEVVLVPIANPIGLGNYVFGRQLGRFELSSRENFNRHYLELAKLVSEQVANELGEDIDVNVELIRECMRTSLQAMQPRTELESLRLILQRLACDADCVLDVHCDSEAMLHIYVHSEQQAEARVLAGLTRAYATLHALEQGGNSFDESFTAVWYSLRQAFPQHPIPMATFAATVELRGLNDVSHELAKTDAEALLAYLCHQGLIADMPPDVPLPLYEPTPLTAVEVLNAPHAGVVAYRAPIGEWVESGTALADIIDPLTDRVSTLTSNIAGVFYARVQERFTEANAELTFVAGQVPIRDGYLLSA
ncbi:M14 family metallopeptidase [Pseudomonas kielensis]|uniref:succinylglutamate desuccinylase/aspartoacylase family protein n=2 Tax=Pseudomonas TaxID=286 RepID=UPI001411BF53|nr:succinylglutamate desuccinylase/aspartoacylase family protein [Pseudomonas kielensis]NBB32505.1 succinylglutamate desuccinylase [Pseudomonas sp. BC115LW]WKL54922.1 M14 family metallopeptidase [Pseudomonas kielensis]